ncbi:MAG: sigma-70 family RNA polymerase sigma factor [Clostridia bacterium]|nr:sigma-70 family RNA polymerase sigma factor [Clostridia bacterium]
MKDSKLLLLIEKDREKGMKYLIEEYSGLVFAVVRARLGRSAFSEPDIEDCVYETFAEFYLDLEKYDPKRSSIKSWLCVIARNNCADAARKKKSSAGLISLDDEKLIEVEDDFSLEGEFIERSQREELLRAVKDLGEPDSQILIRKYYLGQSSAEIAEKLDLGVSNVDTRTHRAVKKLKALFGGDES